MTADRRMLNYCRVNPDVQDLLEQIKVLETKRRTRAVDVQIDTINRRVFELSAAVYRIPIECLCQIFLLVAREEYIFPLVASHVSRTWRQVALHYGPLWAIIRIGSKNGKKGAEYEKLKFWLARAGRSELDLELVLPDRDSPSSAHALIKDHIDHCSRLLLWNISPVKMNLVTSPSTRLRRLDLAGFHVVNVDSVLSMLNGCPNLETLSLRYIHVHHRYYVFPNGVPHVEAIPPSTHPVVSLFHLHSLHLPEWSPELINSLIPRIYTPVLSTVDIAAHNCDPVQNAILHLLPTSGSWDNVTQLTARGCAFKDDILTDCLNLVPNVETLVLRSVWATDAFLLALTNHSLRGWVVPNLRQLDLYTVNEISSEALKSFITARARTRHDKAGEPRGSLERMLVQGCGGVGEELTGWLRMNHEDIDLVMIPPRIPSEDRDDGDD